MALMRQYSSDLIEMHKDTKDLITADLSEVVFKACGHLMFAHAYHPEQPVWWLGHDIISASRLQANS